MNPTWKKQSPRLGYGPVRPRQPFSFTVRGILPASLLIALAGMRLLASEQVPEVRSATPTTPRETYNAGTIKLREGKLREAEAFFQSALASQQESLQPPSLYNLGHVRFRQGVEELKKRPTAESSLNQGKGASQSAADAISAADTALREGNVQRMVASYMRGRGTRRELKAAMGAIRKALETYGAALGKWQRSSGDFRSVLEMNPKHDDAKHNARVVDRHIAKLVDSIQEMQQMAAGLGEKSEELRQKMQQLKGQIPEPNMPPGAAGDDEEEEDQPKGPEPGQKEAPVKQGEEMNLSPEQAGWLLEGFKLDTERRLPMGLDGTAEPRNRPGRDW
jgi:hypothetical protein